MKVSKDLFVGAKIPHKTEVGNPNENPKYIRESLVPVIKEIKDCLFLLIKMLKIMQIRFI